MKKLSICIPTFNRERYLSELIDSIIYQLNDYNRHLIQICISDNCSTDNTKKLVEQFIERGKVDIVFNRNEENIGADLNYLKSVEIASGEYCWLMGSDDIINENSLNIILNQIDINNSISVFLGNRDEYSVNLEFLQNRFWLDSRIKDLIIDFSIEDQVIYYLKKCNSLGGVFSYLSSIIVNREDWNSIKFDYTFNGSAYSHVYILFSILDKSNKLKYFSNSIVKCRNGNDSFHVDNKQRYFLDFNGYFKLFNLFFESKVNKYALNILKKEHKSSALYRLCLNCNFSISEYELLRLIGFNWFTILNVHLMCKYQVKYNKLFYTTKNLYYKFFLNSVLFDK